MKTMTIIIFPGYLIVSGYYNGKSVKVRRPYQGAADVVERAKLVHAHTGVWPVVSLSDTCKDYGWLPFLEYVQSLVHECKMNQKMEKKSARLAVKTAQLPLPILE